MPALDKDSQAALCIILLVLKEGLHDSPILAIVSKQFALCEKLLSDHTK